MRAHETMKASVAAALALCFLATPVLTQQQVYVTLRDVRFSVTDRNGAPVNGLNPEDFTVYDDDRLEEISTFARNVQSPVSVAMVLDRSRSLDGTLPAVVEAAAAFLSSLVRDGEDQGAVVAFDSKVYLLHDWTSDSAALVRTMRTLTAAGGTSVFDALVKTCRDQFVAADARQKAIVLVTDGEDTTSTATIDDALSMARLAKVAVYVLGVRAEHSLNSRELQGRRVLTSLADLTGGRVFYPATRSDASLSALFAHVQQELRNGYSLTYYLDTRPDNAFHRIRIEPKDRTLTVHAPTGYSRNHFRPVS